MGLALLIHQIAHVTPYFWQVVIIKQLMQRLTTLTHQSGSSVYADASLAQDLVEPISLEQPGKSISLSTILSSSKPKYLLCENGIFSTVTIMRTVVELISVENTVFTNFVAYASLLAVKMMLMSLYTAFRRKESQVRLQKELLYEHFCTPSHQLIYNSNIFQFDHILIIIS